MGHYEETFRESLENPDLFWGNAACAVVGVADGLKGEVPLGFIVLKAGVNRDHREIVSEVMQMVRSALSLRCSTLSS